MPPCPYACFAWSAVYISILKHDWLLYLQNSRFSAKFAVFESKYVINVKRVDPKSFISSDWGGVKLQAQ